MGLMTRDGGLVDAKLLHSVQCGARPEIVHNAVHGQNS